MAITVNADDFGIDKSVNEAICLALERGLVDRTTLMVNMPAAFEAMEMAERMGFTGKVGIHLNLTSGMPLTRQILEDPVMCDPLSGFTADFARSMRRRFFLPAATRKNVERELRAQFDRFRDLGGILWHVDSHHHVHTDPSIWLILRKVMKDYPVVSVRLGRNMYRSGNPLMRLYKMILNVWIGRYCRESCSYFGSAADYRAFAGTEPGFSDRCNVEVMVHPVFDAEGKLVDAFEGNNYELVRPGKVM